MKVALKQSVVQLDELIIPPGNRVYLQHLKWQDFETILDDLGESRTARVAYYKGTLEIKMPLPGHETDKEIIGDLVKALLEELDINFMPFGSTTFKREEMQSGAEPDQCFYIQHEPAMRGKREIDLNVDPPPELAIEIDNTSDSRLKLNSYAALGVPEVWRYDGVVLQINILQEGKYVESTISPTFPNLPLVEVITQFLKQSKTAGRNPAIKAFRTWIREHL